METLKTLICPVCGRKNFVYVKYCGGCGRPCNSVREAQFTEKTVKTSYCQVKNKRLFENALNVRKYAISGALLLMIAGISFFGYKDLSADQYTDNRPTWGKIRSFISKKYRMTNAELDFIFAKLTNEKPQLAKTLELNGFLKLEKAVAKRLRDDRASLFPNPFFAEPEFRIIDSKKSEEFVFSDIPLDHPAYQALKPLLEIGVFCCDDSLKLKPNEKLTWKDWVACNEKLWGMLNMDSSSFLPKESIRDEIVSNYDLIEYFEALRSQLGLDKKEMVAWSCDPYFPSRMEAFSALSSLLKELLN